MTDEEIKEIELIEKFKKIIQELYITKIYKLKMDYKLERIMDMLEEYDFLVKEIKND